jgi:hypothetical protein
MKFKISTAIFLILAFMSCKKEVDDGYFALPESAKIFLPVNDELIYQNSTGESDTLLLGSEEKYYKPEVVDTDGSFMTKYSYIQNYEHLIYKFNSGKLNMQYHLYFDQSPFGPMENFEIYLISSFSQEEIKLKVSNEDMLDNIWSCYIHLNTIVLNENTYNDVYYLLSGDKLFYFQQEKGLIGFTYNNVLWVLIN